MSKLMLLPVVWLRGRSGENPRSLAQGHEDVGEGDFVLL